MITGKDIYEVFSALVPLYVAMSLAYTSVRWWKIFTPEQCAGINRFVAVFAIPLLSFKLIAFNNPYDMNFQLILADTLQKVVVLLALFLWQTVISNNGNLDWTITLHSLSTLPNTLVMGIPLLRAMYGDFSSPLMVQIVVFQGVIWYTLLLLMFEYRAAKLFIKDRFPETAGAIAAVEAESNVVSFAGGDSLHAEAEVDNNGKLRVVVSKSSSASSLVSFSKFREVGSATCLTPRASSLTGVEIYSVRSSVEQSSGTPTISSFNQAEFPLHSSSAKETRSGNGIQLNLAVWNSRAPSSPVSVSQRGYQPKHTSSFNRGFLATDQPEIIIDSVEDSSQKQAATLNGYVSKDGNGFGEEDGENELQMPPAKVMTRLILTMVWRKLIRNPNTYSSVIGIVWSLISFRWHIPMPLIIKGSITILSDTGLGMSMFSLGLFMALQPKILACGKLLAVLSLAVRFLVGPAVMAAISAAIGIRGVLLQVSIVQAALPQAIVSFVFAKEYNVHPQILSTSVTIGMVVALPVTILYYVLLGL